ncbi:hypothetical protein GOBAR_AA28740 [Gossypium barbadense]|uniref:Uncharacterized protein n=1 Tax=Gossypium barbadense TaxID=3634 RepID=A0A2P5WLH8_GOSBA|nr:hypothetical protein GOBAR_AA28740 [Gossypium barbadense]
MDSSLAIGRDPMIHDLKESLIGDFEGKKRQRVGDFFEGVFESLDSVRKGDRRLMAYQNKLSVTAKG